jgi:transposase
LRFEVSPSAAVNLMRRVRETGSIAPGRIGGPRRRVLEPHEALLQSLVAVKWEINLAEIRADLRVRGVVVQALSTVHHALRRLDLTHKKSLRAAEQDRPDAARHRRRWRVWQRSMDPSRFMFLDETDASTNMVRRYGRCPRGERLVGAAPWGHWKTTIFVAGLRSNVVIAPMVLAGPMSGGTFRSYVERTLAPALSLGDVVVMDNLAAHKVAGVRKAIQAVGASVLYLPPYSPDVNPIEQLFAKLKALLRSVAARTKAALWDAIGHALDAFPEAECQNYLTKYGYEPVLVEPALAY